MVRAMAGWLRHPRSGLLLFVSVAALFAACSGRDDGLFRDVGSGNGPSGGASAAAGMGGASVAGSGGTGAGSGGASGSGAGGADAGGSAGSTNGGGGGGSGAGTAGTAGASGSGPGGGGAAGTMGGNGGADAGEGGDAGAPDGAGAGGDAGTPGCTGDHDCTASDQYCKKEACNAATGHCTARTDACTGYDATFNPVCGCDGMTYYNPCVAEREGVNVRTAGECSSNGTVRCSRDEGGDSCEPERRLARCYRQRNTCSNPSPAMGVCWVLPDECPEEPEAQRYCPGTSGDTECIGLCEVLEREDSFYRNAPNCPD